MKKVGDYVVYRKDVCKITEIKEKYMKETDYYRLVPINDESLQVTIPVNSEFIRELVTKEEVEKLIQKMPDISTIKCDDKLLETEYKNLMNSNSLEDYIKIIKTTYLRNKKREENKKKLSDKDSHYLDLAEKYLYNEFSIILNKSYEETKNYIMEKVTSMQ